MKMLQLWTTVIGDSNRQVDKTPKQDKDNNEHKKREAQHSSRDFSKNNSFKLASNHV